LASFQAMAIRAHSLLLVWHIVQCAGKQCSDSVGTCSSQPRTSLMQTRSLKKQALSAVEAASTRTQTLAGYKEYVNKLVAQYKGDDPTKKSRDEIQPGSDVDNAITTIIQYINSMYEDLLAWHTQDLDDADACKSTALLSDCQDVLPTDHEIEKWMTQVNLARQKHTTCRDGCSSVVCEDNVACQEYNDYRKKKQANGHLIASFTDAVACANPSLDDEYIQSSPGPDGRLEQMENCLKDAKEWLDPLYRRYIACHESETNCKDCQVQCDHDQAAFESAHCQLDLERDVHCPAYRTCYEAAHDQCMTTCQKITVRSNARAADNETGEFIICLLGALRAPEASRKATLRECDDLPNTEHTDAWKIDCGDLSEEPPPTTFCGDAEQPCDQNFLNHEYGAYGEYKDSCDPDVNDGYKECLRDADGQQSDEHGSHLQGTYGMINKCTECPSAHYYWNPHKVG